MQNEMGEHIACIENIKFWLDILKGEDYSKALDLYGSIILKEVLRVQRRRCRDLWRILVNMVMNYRVT